MTNEEFQKAVLTKLDQSQKKFEENDKFQKAVLTKLDQSQKKFEENDKFQKAVLTKLDQFQKKFEENDKFQKRMESFQKTALSKFRNSERTQKAVLTRLESLEGDVQVIKLRQDEIFEVAKAIEHSNQAGRSELDSHNVRLSKVEGKLKKASKALVEDNEDEKASNL